MFNVLLVDDDKIDVEGLSQFVNWDELGYKVIGTAHSAAEAVSIIETEFVDVVLTDIVMPGKNGLELIKDALEINPSIKTVILSGYGEFEFAKEAIRLGAFDYLMKPVNFGELKNIFNRLKINLHQDILEKQKQVEYMGTRRMQFMNNLVNGFLQNVEGVVKKASEIGLQLNEADYCLIRLLLDETTIAEHDIQEKDYVNIKSGLADGANTFLNNYGKAYVFDNNIREVCVLFYPFDITKLEMVLEKFLQFINTNEAMNMFLGVGSIYNTISNIPQAYSEAGRALEYRYIKKDHLLYYKYIAEFFKGRSIITSDIETKIQEHLLNGDTKSFEEYILKIIFNIYRGDWSDKGVLFEACIEILLIINRCIGKYVSGDKSFLQSDHNAIRALLKKESYEDVRDFISLYLREIMSGINSAKEKPLGFAIENVMKYIKEHYNENLSLQKLSEVVYMHPTYLSKLFKEKTGETFLEYLTKVRIDQAKKLLQNLSLRIYDICEMVGYDSPKHFCKVFKDITGSTPKDYRKQSMLQIDENERIQ